MRILTEREEAAMAKRELGVDNGVSGSCAVVFGIIFFVYVLIVSATLHQQGHQITELVKSLAGIKTAIALANPGLNFF